MFLTETLTASMIMDQGGASGLLARRLGIGAGPGRGLGDRTAGGLISDMVSPLALHGRLGAALSGHRHRLRRRLSASKSLLFFATLIAIGPLARHRTDPHMTPAGPRRGDCFNLNSGSSRSDRCTTSLYVIDFRRHLAVFSARFSLFFIRLVIYLRREDRREGYPLEDDLNGRLRSGRRSVLFTALAQDLSPAPWPEELGDQCRTTNAIARPRGAPHERSGPRGLALIPTGDPLLAGVGPGSLCGSVKAARLTASWRGQNRAVAGGDELLDRQRVIPIRSGMLG